ncbi:MAG: hypothetical protein WC890_04140 [Candidatus Margulisiibacteriota bacterium]
MRKMNLIIVFVAIVFVFAGCVNAPKSAQKAKLAEMLATSEVKVNLSIKDRLLKEGGELILSIGPDSSLAGGLQDIETNAVINLEPAEKIGKTVNASSSAIPNPGGDGSRDYRYVHFWKMISENNNEVNLEIYFYNNQSDKASKSPEVAKVLIFDYQNGKFLGKCL